MTANASLNFALALLLLALAAMVLVIGMSSKQKAASRPPIVVTGGNPQEPMELNSLYSAISTIAQVAAALAALLGFLGLLRWDRLQNEANMVERALAGLIRLSPFNETLEISPAGVEGFKELFSDDFLMASGLAIQRGWQITYVPEPGLSPIIRALIVPVYKVVHSM
jgi:hypothetical protein